MSRFLFRISARLRVSFKFHDACHLSSFSILTPPSKLTSIKKERFKEVSLLQIAIGELLLCCSSLC